MEKFSHNTLLERPNIGGRSGHIFKIGWLDSAFRDAKRMLQV